MTVLGQISNWADFDAEFAELISSVRKGNVALPPFALLALPSSPDDQLRCAQQHVAANVVLSEKPVWTLATIGFNPIACLNSSAARAVLSVCAAL
jgi:hypothetical protein